MKFKVGDVCEIVHADPEKFTGMECTIASDEDWQYRPEGPFWCYVVRFADGTIGYADPRVLRLKRPPSWDSWLFDMSDVEREESESASSKLQARYAHHVQERMKAVQVWNDAQEKLRQRFF